MRTVSGTQIVTCLTSSIDICLKENDSDDGGNQLPVQPQMGFVQESTLLKHPFSTPLTGQSSNTNPLPCEKTLKCIQPDLLVPTPPSAQQMCQASKSVSRPLEVALSSSMLCSKGVLG